ncbi:MAG: DNA primase [Gemmatimonas sp.]|nr:DNA primase [Gemmatimonas sp.]
MSIADHLIEEVRARADLVEIISEVTPLKRSGRTFRGACPLHGGEGPNFSVDPNRNIFHCFTCGEGGDLFSFPMKHFGLGFLDAVRWVAARVGVEIPEEDQGRGAEDPHAPLHQANAFAAEWFRARLLDPEIGLEARGYLEGRGITAEASERFGIGWAPAGWSGLSEAAAAHGLSRELLLGLGLLKAPTKGGREPYDAFRGRVVFPIVNQGGRVVAFGGRVIGSVEAHVPKYLNSPESPVYHKGGLLYGLRWSRGPIRKGGTALVVEGYMDYLSLASNGIESAVAPLGTALTQEQAELLARYASRVILLYDSDTAGLKATFRAGDELLRAGVEVLVATLPDGEDPDSLVRRGGSPLLSRYLDDAVDVLERKIQILERRNFFATIAGKRRAVDALLPTVRATADEVLRGLYVDRIAGRTGVPAETVAREVEADGQGRGQEPGRSTRPAGRHRPERSRTLPIERLQVPRLGAERNVIMLLLRDEQWLERAAERLSPADFHDPLYREIYVELLHRHAEGSHEHVAGLLEALEGTAAERAQELLSDPEGSDLAHPDRFFEDNLQRIAERNVGQRLDAINRELETADSVRQQELLGEYRQLRTTMQGPGLGRKMSPPGMVERSDGPA